MVARSYPRRPLLRTEADPAVMPDAALTPMNDEAVQVLIAPPQRSLQGGVEIGDRTVAANVQAAPDQRADPAQDDAQLVHHRLGGSWAAQASRDHAAGRHLTGSPSPGYVHSRGLP